MSHRIDDRMTDMIFVQGGRYAMGSERFYPEERPVHPVTVGSLLFDRFPVTNRKFSEFVEATGYRTRAESPDPEIGGSLAARPSGPAMPPGMERWDHVPTASWRQPLGEGSSVDGLADHPVVHIGYADALAYAEWCGKDLPTEAEWEYAARGGLANCEYAWGEELAPDGEILANYRHGPKPPPPANAVSTTPVGSFPPNGLGLHDMIGNVWEWTKSPYSVGHLPARSGGDCCSTPETVNPDRLLHCIKGGSFLCSPAYCRRYRPAARQGVDMMTTTNHLGFRCVQRSGP